MPLSFSSVPVRFPWLPRCGTVALLMISACGSAEDPENTDESASQLVEGPGAFDADFRTSDDFFTLMSGPVAGASPHGTVQIWYSTHVRDLIEGDSDEFTVPVGTVAIKTGDMEGDGTVDAITVMVKQESGYDPEHQDWLYEMRAVDGALQNDEASGMPMSGTMQMCISCHAAYASRDYLAGTSLR